MTRNERILAAVNTLGLQVMSMSCGVVAFEVSKIVGETVTYAEIEAALEPLWPERGMARPPGGPR